MRLSTSEISQSSINSILNQQSQLNHIQQELSTGRSIVTPSDNPAGAAQALGLQSAIDTNSQYQSNGNAATASLNLEQSTLTQAINVLQSVRTLTLQGNNGTQSNQSRASIATQVNQELKQLLSLSNTQDSNGNYIFAGSKTNTQPFSENASGGFTYAGDAAQHFVQIDSSRQIATNDPGSNVFKEIPAGNGTFTVSTGTPATATTPAVANTGSGVAGPGSVTNISDYHGGTYTIKFTGPKTYDVYSGSASTGTLISSNNTYTSGSAIKITDNTSGTPASKGIEVTITGSPAANDTFTLAPSGQQSVFQTLQSIANSLNTPTANSPPAATALHNTLNQQLASLDQALNNMVNVQASVGSRQSAITSQQTLQQNWGVQLKSAQSKIQDVNVTSAISQFQLELTALQASQKTYTQVQGLSLFKYI